MKRVIALPALLTLLSACGGSDPAPADGTAARPDGWGEEEVAETVMEVRAGGAAAVAQAPATFAQCKVCHAAEPGRNGIGPSLAGAFGARAGHEPSFAYSTAMRESGKVWDEANLDAYLENPRGFIPGNRMSFAGLRDPAKRKEVIDYLKTL